MPKRPQIMPSMTHSGLRVALVGLLIVCLTTAGAAQTPTAPPIRKTVLFLSSYQMDLPVNTLAVQAMQEEFQQAADLSVNIHYEYLDLNRFPDAAYQEALFDLYRMKYRGKPIDAVIVGNADTLKLWLAKRADIVPNAPVLFYDINTTTAKSLALPPDVSGVTAEVDFVKSVRWFLQTRPAVNELILVHGAGKTDQAFRQYVDAVQAELCGTVHCSDWSSLPLADMMRRAAALPDSAVIVYFLLFEDAAGMKYKPIDAIRQLTAASSVPVLSGYDQFIGTGTIGGYMYSIEQQARSVAQMGLRILRGEPISAMPVQFNSGTRFIFDHRALQHWNIPLAALPPDRLLKHRQHTVWDYWLQLFALSAGMVILTGIVFYLSILTRRLHIARQSLMQINANLERQVQERTAALSESNQRLIAENTERQQTEKRLRESEEKFSKAFHSNQVAMSLSSMSDGRYIDVNAEFLRLAGRPRDEIIGQTSLQLGVWVHPAQRDELMRTIREQGSIHNAELEINAKSGKILTLLWSAEQVTLNDLPCLLVSTFDISERKQAEQALLESEDRYRRISSVISDIAYSCVQNDAGVYEIDWMTGATERILGYAVDEIIARRCWGALVIEEDVALFTQQILRLAPGSRSACELRLRHKNGSIRWVSSLAECVMSNNRHQLYGGLMDITERKQTEEALRESEARWQFALEGSGDGVWDWNSQTNLVFFSNQWKFMFGFEPDEIGDSLSEWDSRVHPDDRDRVYAAIQRHFDGLTPIYMSEHRVCCKDGEYKWILDRGKVISRTPDGKPLRVIGTHSDISARKQAEQILQENEAKYRRLVENIPDILYVFSNLRGGIFYSPCLKTILGYAPEYLYQHPMLWNQSIHPDDMPKVIEAITQFQQGQHFKVEYRIKDAEGEWRWLYDRSIGRQELPGELLIEGLALDTTDRKRAEDDLRLFKTIVETSEEAIAISDAAGRLLYINPAHVRLFGRSLDEARQANYREYYPPESVEILNREVAPSLASGKSWQGVIDVFDASGRRFPLWEHADSIRDADGNMLYGFGFMHDDTLRKNVEDALKQAKAAAENANRTKSAFLANMSHELRTPLNAILGYAQILKRDQALSEYVHRGLNIIEDSGNYLLELINDILDLAKVEAGKLEIHPAPMSLFVLLDDAQALMAIKAEQKGLRFEVIKDASLPEHVEGDAHRLRQILLNLLGNAIKFTDHGSVTLRVTGENVETHGCASYGHETHNRASLRFSIEDTGVGIAPDDLRMLFAPFQQVGDAAHKAQGTGLGLAISRNLATLMGGTLTVTSTVGVGSVFRFEVSLPVLAAPATLAAQRVIIGVNGVAPTILVVDDVAANRQVLAELLHPYGCRILQAANGEEAIRQALAEHPTAIITDLKMPDSDGFELIQRLRQTQECQNIIIIVSSASVYADDQERSLKAGGQAFLPKPVQAEMLYELLERFGVAKWRYQEETLAPAAEILPPFATLKTLFEFANIGDIPGFREQLALLAASDATFTPFVTRLQELAQHFQLEQIRENLLHGMEESEDHHGDLLLESNGATAIPPDWLDRLRRAIVITDIQDITDILHSMRVIDPVLTESLEKLAYNFEYDKMLRLL